MKGLHTVRFHFSKILRVHLSFYSCQAESESKSAINSGRSSEDESLYQGEKTIFLSAFFDLILIRISPSFPCRIISLPHLCMLNSVSFERLTQVFFLKIFFGEFFHRVELEAVLRIRIRRIHRFLGLLDSDPDPSVIKQKCSKKTLIPTVL
jgi:hypothetical protein